MYRPQRFQHEQGIAARGVVKPADDGSARTFRHEPPHQFPRLWLGERFEHDASVAPGAIKAANRLPLIGTCFQLEAAVGDADEQGRPGEVGGECIERPQRVLVDTVEVVEDQHGGCELCERYERSVKGLTDPVSLLRTASQGDPRFETGSPSLDGGKQGGQRLQPDRVHAFNELLHPQFGQAVVERAAQPLERPGNTRRLCPSP